MEEILENEWPSKTWLEDIQSALMWTWTTKEKGEELDQGIEG